MLAEFTQFSTQFRQIDARQIGGVCILLSSCSVYLASRWCKSAKTALNWFSKGIKLNIVPALHSSQDKAPQWHSVCALSTTCSPTQVGKDTADT